MPASVHSPSKPIDSQREAQLRARPLPRHVGIIMDGNGRWAEQRGLPRLEGHREGSTSVREVSRTARRLGIEALTLYAFSSQNWARPAEEVAGLMQYLREYLISERSEILDNGIRLVAMGEVDKLPNYVREPLEALALASKEQTGMVLNLALSYGGREELLHAARRLAKAVASGRLDPDGMDLETLERELWTYPLPPVDLVIRTSGERRLSNFLLYQSAYAELYFTEKLWPEFRAAELLDAVSEFQGRERRMGKTSAQLRESQAS